MTSKSCSRCWLLPLLGMLQAGSAAATSLSPATPFDVTAGGSSPGAWAASAQVGFPWQAVHIQYGLGGGWTPFLEATSALLQRNHVSAGLALRWVDGYSVRVTGEALVGAVVQRGDLAERGPSGELRIRAAWLGRRFSPYIALGTRHTLLLNRTTLETREGEDRSIEVEHRWTPLATLGLAVALGRTIALEAGLDLFRPGPDAVSIPGLHLGLQVGGGR